MSSALWLTEECNENMRRNKATGSALDSINQILRKSKEVMQVSNWKRTMVVFFRLNQIDWNLLVTLFRQQKLLSLCFSHPQMERLHVPAFPKVTLRWTWTTCSNWVRRVNIGCTITSTAPTSWRSTSISTGKTTTKGGTSPTSSAWRLRRSSNGTAPSTDPGAWLSPPCASTSSSWRATSHRHLCTWTGHRTG